jgi:ABC-type branched-subunit amino acid transport system substrate-binding protein
MTAPRSTITRRNWLGSASLMAAAVSMPCIAQSSKSASLKNTVIAQVVDNSPSQLDVSRDFLVGSRAAWQDINLKGGLRGRQIQHMTLETDGTTSSLRAALEAIKGNASCLVMSGTAGDSLATQLVVEARQVGLKMAHVAPWLQNSNLELDDQIFPIFAARQEQIIHALKSLSVMGLSELGVIYGSTQDQSLYQAEVARIAASMQLKLQAFQAGGELRLLGQKMTTQTPAILLFVGGTPELAEFTQGLEKQSRQRYVVALADVNLQTLSQMGAARNTPIIATQPVPPVNSSASVVRSYRETLARLFDEPPTALSLAGFIAARYTYEVLNDVEGSLTRQTALAEFQKRSMLDLGGFRISFNAQRRSSTYVTQTMMTLDGRLIG